MVERKDTIVSYPYGREKCLMAEDVKLWEFGSLGHPKESQRFTGKNCTVSWRFTNHKQQKIDSVYLKVPPLYFVQNIEEDAVSDLREVEDRI